jgi:hypothetical protein
MLPEIEIRFEQLNISAHVYVAGRALPTLINWAVNIVEVLFPLFPIPWLL